MSRYIDADKMISDTKAMKRIAEGIAIEGIIKYLEENSLTDVEEVEHGVWEWNPDGMDWGLGAWECSKCHHRNNMLPISKTESPYMFAGSNFCPNCGAKMGRERKEKND